MIRASLRRMIQVVSLAVMVCLLGFLIGVAGDLSDSQARASQDGSNSAQSGPVARLEVPAP